MVLMNCHCGFWSWVGQEVMCPSGRKGRRRKCVELRQILNLPGDVSVREQRAPVSAPRVGNTISRAIEVEEGA